MGFGGWFIRRQWMVIAIAVVIVPRNWGEFPCLPRDDHPKKGRLPGTPNIDGTEHRSQPHRLAARGLGKLSPLAARAAREWPRE